MSKSCRITLSDTELHVLEAHLVRSIFNRGTIQVYGGSIAANLLKRVRNIRAKRKVKS